MFYKTSHSPFNQLYIYTYVPFITASDDRLHAKLSCDAFISTNISGSCEQSTLQPTARPPGHFPDDRYHFKVVGGSTPWKITPPKFNMEPENDGFQKESPFPGTSFQVPC